MRFAKAPRNAIVWIGCVKPRLLFISRKWPPAVGGMETYSVELAAALELNFSVTKLVLPGRPDGRPPTLIGYGMFLLKAMLHCLLYGRRFNYVVFGDLILFPAALCCRLTRKAQNRVVVVYGLDLVYGQRQGLLPRCYALYLSAFRACQGLFVRLVAISGHTADLAKAYGLGKVAIVNPSLPTTPLTTAAASEVALPDGFIRAPRRILQFGRLVPRKGALWFAQNVLPGLPGDITFFVAGSAHGYPYLAELEACERTHYLGPLSTDLLAALIRKADLVVMPNIPSPRGAQDAEGFGLVAIETSSLGGLLVAARLQGIEDAVQDGATGTLVAPGDAQAWQAALGRLLGESTEKRASRRQRARIQTRLHYSRERMGTEFARCLVPTPQEQDNDGAKRL